jgi:hypothetical protein
LCLGAGTVIVSDSPHIGLTLTNDGSLITIIADDSNGDRTHNIIFVNFAFVFFSSLSPNSCVVET